MNKADLVEIISKEASITKVQADTALNTLMSAITEALKKKDKVQLFGFGTFSVVERAARTSKLPQSDTSIQVPARKIAKFKPGKDLSAAIK